jgi:hypothetical protein
VAILMFCTVGLAGSGAVAAFLFYLSFLLVRRLNATWFDPQWRFARRLRRLFDEETPGPQHQNAPTIGPREIEETGFVGENGRRRPSP